MSPSSDSNPWRMRLPLTGETCVFSHGYWESQVTNTELISHWKRDALLFDRVYAKYKDGAPPPDIPIQLSFGLETVDQEMLRFDANSSQMIAQAFAGCSQDEINKALGISDGDADPLGFDRELAVQYSQAGIMGEWTYASTGAYLRRFTQGENIAYEGALSNIPLVSAGAASWDQILAFRSDPEAVRKYRDLRLWLRSGLKAESAQHAADIIGQKIDDYRWAIKRHGLQTSLGAFKTIFDWRESKLSVAVTGIAAATGGPVWAGMAGGISIALQVGAWLAERRIDVKDTVRGPNREVAILYDVQEHFKQ
jgi:hypothetical protein